MTGLSRNQSFIIKPSKLCKSITQYSCEQDFLDMEL
jgi:hypothetical protein